MGESGVAGNEREGRGRRETWGGLSFDYYDYDDYYDYYDYDDYFDYYDYYGHFEDELFGKMEEDCEDFV